MPVPSALNGRKSRGATTEAGKRKAALARVTHGISASRLYVLEGIEDPQECERFRRGFFEVWHPVGIHEEECVIHIAHGYWRLRRAARYEAEAIIAEMLQGTQWGDFDVARQVEAILGKSEANGNGETLGESSDPWDSTSRWHKILCGADELEISHQDAEELFGFVIEQIFDEEDQEGDTVPEPAFTIPEGVTGPTRTEG